MSTAESIETLPQTDPFFYGWREVRRNGVLEQIPLTREDVLHPQEGDHVTNSHLHHVICTKLETIFARRLKGVEGAQVFGDMAIFWDVPGLKNHGPDLGVVFGASDWKKKKSFNVGTEGVRPALLVEVTSSATWNLDLDDKVRHYARANVPQYVIIDIEPRRGVSVPRFLGYQLVDGEYQLTNADEPERLWLEAVRLWLCLADGEVVCEDEYGVRVPDFMDLDEALQAESEARQAESEARAAAEEKVRALEAELRRLRGGE